jgi:heme-degrading monooxygenase HmoA
MLANTPPPPYYAVIFSSIRTDNPIGYSDMAQRMVELATDQPGFLGVESARNEVGITVSYWATEADIQRWKQHAEHLIAQQLGRTDWYSAYKTRIAKVERDYGFGGRADA